MNIQQINSTGLQLWVVVATAAVLIVTAMVMWRVTERVRKALDVFDRPNFEVTSELGERRFRPVDMYNTDKVKTILELIYFDGDWKRVQRKCFLRLCRMAREQYGCLLRLSRQKSLQAFS